jgi:hypothetical protein
MRGSIVVLAAAVVTVGLGAALADDDAPYDAEPDAPALSDREAERACADSWATPTNRLRQAIQVVARRRLCRAETGLVGVLDDVERDDATRGLAALGLGELACHAGHRGRRVEGLSETARASLETATGPGPALVRQSATRALGRARSVASVPVLEERRADGDAVVRFLAAQALTRVTATDQFDADFRDDALAQFLSETGEYTVTDDSTVAP